MRRVNSESTAAPLAAAKPPMPAGRDLQQGDRAEEENRYHPQNREIGLEAHPIGQQEQIGLNGVDDHDRLVMVEAQRQQLVVNMILVGAEGRSTLADALHHHAQRIQNRQCQQQNRRRRAHHAVAALSRAQAQHADGKAEQLTPRIAHE